MGDFVRGVCSVPGSHYPEVPKFVPVGVACAMYKQGPGLSLLWRESNGNPKDD